MSNETGHVWKHVVWLDKGYYRKDADGKKYWRTKKVATCKVGSLLSEFHAELEQYAPGSVGLSFDAEKQGRPLASGKDLWPETGGVSKIKVLEFICQKVVEQDDRWLKIISENGMETAKSIAESEFKVTYDDGENATEEEAAEANKSYDVHYKRLLPAAIARLKNSVG